MPFRYLLYRGVRVQNETGHKWTPRYGSPLFGKIFPDQRSTAAVKPSLLYVLSFIGGAREKKEEKGDRSAGGAHSRLLWVHSFSISSLLPPSFPLSLFLPMQVEIKYLKHARRFWLSRTRCFPLFPSINLFFLFLFLLIFTSRPFFFSSFSAISRVRGFIDRGETVRWPTGDALHLAAISLSEIKLIFARPISLTAYIVLQSFSEFLPSTDSEVKQDGILLRPLGFFLQPQIIGYCNKSTIFILSFIFVH